MISMLSASHTDEEAIVQKYFEYSNNANFEGIASLLHAEIMYASSATGTYSGIEPVLAMQKNFFAKFSSLRWHIEQISTNDCAIVVTFLFQGTYTDGTAIEKRGIEKLNIQHGKIVQIEIQTH